MDAKLLSTDVYIWLKEPNDILFACQVRAISGDYGETHVVLDKEQLVALVTHLQELVSEGT